VVASFRDVTVTPFFVVIVGVAGSSEEVVVDVLRMPLIAGDRLVFAVAVSTNNQAVTVLSITIYADVGGVCQSVRPSVCLSRGSSRLHGAESFGAAFVKSLWPLVFIEI